MGRCRALQMLVGRPGAVWTLVGVGALSGLVQRGGALWVLMERRGALQRWGACGSAWRLWRL